MSSIKSRHTSSDFETLGVLAAFMLVLCVTTHRQVFAIAALVLLLVALFVKPLARLISRGWLAFAELLGTFNSKVILSLAFFLFLTPLAFIYRIFNKNPLGLKAGAGGASRYVTRDHVYSKSDFEKMW